MSLRDLTAASHAAAEDTKFMKAVFAKTLPLDIWADFLYQKWLFYGAIENKASSLGLLKDLDDIRRTLAIYDDYCELTALRGNHAFRQVSKDYQQYILSLTDPNKIMAHLYTWHMGDMHGGQMIAKTINTPRRHLDFIDRPELIKKVRAKLDDSMADEANIAFGWAIKIMNEYDC